jgi:opacity protein-like surface antigen
MLLPAMCLGLPLTACGQSMPTATRAGDLQLGGGLVFARSNYNFNPMSLVGGTGYVSFDPKTHYGGEFNFHNVTSTQDSTVYERTYEIGPRVYLVHGSTVPYAKFLYGRGVYNFSNNIANIAYNIYTVGGGADFRVLRSMNIRADYEYQTWPGFPLKTLHPSVITIGVAFHFHE